MTELDHPERCTSCGSSELTRLPMVLTDGTEVLFVSCQRCEARVWLTRSSSGWHALPISTVLERSTRKT
jgi:hypothetical protein